MFHERIMWEEWLCGVILHCTFMKDMCFEGFGAELRKTESAAAGRINI